jgi:RNA ligase (TIGR02306 family)
MERKLATIRQIDNIQPIEGADMIELATVGGWKVVVAKDVNHKVGDLVVYCEIDSFLPIEPEFEFLRKSSYKKMADGTEGFRLKTIKLRGQVSQGLILPLKDAYNVFKRNTPNMDMNWFEGLEVTEMLNIVKYEPPVPAQLSGQVKGMFPSFLKKTDEERIQNLTREFEGYKNEVFYVTEKLDGSSVTYYVKDGVFGVCSRNLDLVESEGNSMWKFAITSGLKERLLALDRNIAVQGEIIGEGIQGNPYKIIGQTVRLFNGFDIDKYEYLSLDDLLKLSKWLEVKTVPILDLEFRLPDTIDELLSYADSKSVLNEKFDREGVVIRSHDRKISFKAISNKFLLNEK